MTIDENVSVDTQGSENWQLYQNIGMLKIGMFKVTDSTFFFTVEENNVKTPTVAKFDTLSGRWLNICHTTDRIHYKFGKEILVNFSCVQFFVGWIDCVWPNLEIFLWDWFALFIPGRMCSCWVIHQQLCSMFCIKIQFKCLSLSLWWIVDGLLMIRYSDHPLGLICSITTG